ncbi:c-type cytochrome domain-containing protein [Granulicella arctica]|uniref:Mono/diheme cytochrome c family protein n=1 Tax=Granulicella arctica TaxID=940613 RepID=A0A7Y9PHG7_9BACT|nr:c-type cytochrome domain-containing protein [Granulicella arctica]NYF79830.1 mono/diheme cytochrome c family protein [Granulicella arctica]
MKKVVVGMSVLIMALTGWGSQIRNVEAGTHDEAARPEFYATHVLPILKANCYRCHGGINHRGGLSVETQMGMLKGGEHGASLIPGDPAKSLLVQLIRHEGPADDPMPMPPKASKLSDADIATITRWIKEGAIMPENTVKP